MTKAVRQTISFFHLKNKVQSSLSDLLDLNSDPAGSNDPDRYSKLDPKARFEAKLNKLLENVEKVYTAIACNTRITIPDLENIIDDSVEFKFHEIVTNL